MAGGAGGSGANPSPSNSDVTDGAFLASYAVTVASGKSVTVSWNAQ
jgi:hypothetical protein